MRIHQIQITGFGPFRDIQTVNFDDFADHGIFLIAGRTGAGKSSILDAIVYALYDSAPRYGNGGGKQLRSDHCGPLDPTRVELTFSAAGQTYRIVRTPEYVRPKARGNGLTTEKSTAELSRRDGDQWVAMASQLRTVGEELHQILPLRCDQFLQVVLLAQGQFQQFLVASSDERQKLLRTLFNSDRFTDYDALIQQRSSTVRQELNLADSAVSSTIAALAQHASTDVSAAADEAWLTEILDAHATDVEVARADVEQAQKELASAQEALDLATDVAGRQRRFSAASAVMARLIAQHDSITADRARCERGTAARSVKPAHTAVLAATEQVAAAATALEAAERRYVDVAGTPPVADLSGRFDELTAELAVLQSRRADEQELHRLTRGAQHKREDLADLMDTVKSLTHQRQRHEEVAASPLGQTREQAEVALVGLEAERQRSIKRDATRTRLQQAELQELHSGRVRTDASVSLDSLRERRLAQYAGSLAQQLREGQACGVCGATEHPQPAELVGEPVTEVMMDAAQLALDRADHQARAASELVVALRTTIEDLADVRPVAELTELVGWAEQRVAAAELAERERSIAHTELERITAEQKTLDVDRATLEQEIRSVQEQVIALGATVEKARGAAGSISEQIDVVTARQKATSSVIEARAAVANAESQHAKSGGTWAQMLAHHGFADERALREAHIEQPVLDDLTAEVAAYDKAYAGAEATLAAPELQDLPAQPADVDAARAAHSQARLDHDACSRRHGVAEARVTTSLQLAVAIRQGWASSAQTRAAFEVLDRLAKSLHGESPNTKRMRLESYVLAAELEQIVQAANLRLHAMSSGRYALQRSIEVATRGTNAGLEVRVADEYTGEIRTPESLSGGEKFLASLALALGLAEVVTSRAGGITLDTLFIDEGFGSLDDETLDAAMDTLDSLRENGRTIGLISHVESMKDRLPAQLVVDKSVQGTSTIAARV